MYGSKMAQSAWSGTKNIAGGVWDATLPAREMAGSAASAASGKLEQLKKDYMSLGLPMKIAIPAGTATAIAAVGYGISQMGGGQEEGGRGPSDRDMARVSQINRQAAQAPSVHNSYKGPSPSANDAYSNLSALALAEERVRISKKTAPGKEEEAINKLRQEYDLLRGYGKSLGGLYSDE